MATQARQSAPATNVSEETDLIVFYDELSSLVRSIPKQNVLVIGGDMKAQIGKNVNHKFSLHNSPNRNGQHLTVFTLENILICLNTNFQKSNGKLSTYTYAHNTKAHIDYVSIKKGVSSDHRIDIRRPKHILRMTNMRISSMPT